jgi:hypothetical protein
MEGKLKKDHDGCPDVADLETNLRKRFEDLLAFCCDRRTERIKYFRFEKELFKRVFELARLFVVLFLVSRHERLEPRLEYSERRFRRGAEYAVRTLQTLFGEVTYGRLHLKRRRKGGPGYHPLDVELGLTRDGYSLLTMSFLTRLATRMSYEAVQVICRGAWGWAPSTETLHAMVRGLGGYAGSYVDDGQWWKRKKKRKGEGGVLVIEMDGKCPPTATEEELKKRRGPRSSCPRCCQRHRGKEQRKKRGPKKRRRKGDKSKNGKEAMVIVMYTLRRGADGLLHGPINKKVWSTFAGRSAAATWARAEATRRGFPPRRNCSVQVVMDGANGLESNMRALFKGSIFTLDVRHVEERIWKAGRAFHREGSAALKAWVEERRKQLYEGEPQALLAWLQGEQDRLSAKRGTKAKVAALGKLILHVKPRLDMLRYASFKRNDLVLATGQVEGAVRYVVAQRFDCAGMRWIVENAESLLQLRCLEVNGDWEGFIAWTMRQTEIRLRRYEKVRIRAKTKAAVAHAA